MITLTGAREHNLKEVSLQLEAGSWTAVTGLSGSGKTSLVFDTLVREGRRRFLGAWSSRARMSLGKLGSADLDSLEGLPVPMAVGAGRMTRTERSTVGTLTGILDLLRLVWARDGAGGPHRRSDFSFNSAGACPACNGLGQTEAISTRKIIVHPERSIRAGALGPTLANGYTVYSQVTVDVMDHICKHHGFSIDTPWEALSPAQQHVILFGTTELIVPFGKHSLESRLKWEGITARPRTEGHYRGLVPVMRDTLKRSRNPNILRYAASVPCTTCAGSRLGETGRTTTVDGLSLPLLSRLPLVDLQEKLRDLQSPVLDALRTPIEQRLEHAIALGIGHLSLDRTSTTLSDGELQRTRLLSQLGLKLGGLLLAFDEPTLGLHPDAHPGLAAAIRDLLALGNTVLTVEHDPLFVNQADHLVQVGPGAGSSGGEIVCDQPMPDAPLGRPTDTSRERKGDGEIDLLDATLNGLRTDLHLRTAALNVICGPSGSGKTSLIFGTLLPALRSEPALHSGLLGAEGWKVLSVDSRPLGKTARSTIATYTGLFDAIRKLFAASPDAKANGLKASHFSHNNKAGRCPDCEGLGVQRIGLHLMRDVEQSCPSCAGGRYRPEVLAVRWQDHTIADVLQLTALEARPLFAQEARIHPMLTALIELGLGYLQLGRSTTSISRGESQRIKLATQLGRPTHQPTVILLDEPDRGLHPDDLERLLSGLHALVDAGHTLVAISHHPGLWLAADHLIEVRAGVASIIVPPELPELPRPSLLPSRPPSHIELRGVRTHNLQNLNVRIPHRTLTVVCGRSGSGKSSLVFDTLAAEAQRRFAETLPFQVRRFLRQLPAPNLDAASGLSPTLSLQQTPSPPSRRSTLATQTGIGPLLRLLFAREGTLNGRVPGLLAEHFSTERAAGRCPDCTGRGTERRCTAELLVSHPDDSLLKGALSGTKPGRFFTEAKGRHLALLGALIGAPRLDVPWKDLSERERKIALEGHPSIVKTTWRYQRGKRSGEHELEERWTGFLALATEEARLRRSRKDAAAWLAPFEEIPCATCSGAGLQAPAREVRWGGRTFMEVNALSIDALHDLLTNTTSQLPPLIDELIRTLGGLQKLKLGHLKVSSPSTAFTPSEGQRVRLAEVLFSGLTGLTLALDEPGNGLDEDGLRELVGILQSLVDQGNTVVVVSHRPTLIRAAQHLIELGPGAGDDGGRLLAEGPSVLTGEGPTASAIRETSEHPVVAAVSSLPERGLVVLEGGSLEEQLRWMNELELPTHTSVSLNAPLSASTVAFALNLMGPLQAAFHRAHPELPKRAFSHHSPAGRCPACKGSGYERIAMDILADLELPCPTCRGARYRPEVLDARIDGRSIIDVLQAPLSRLGLTVPSLQTVVQSARDLGIGHLHGATPLTKLSGGERLRLALLVALCTKGSKRLFTLKDPTAGLHPLDIPQLARALRKLPHPDDLVVMITENPMLIRLAQPVHLGSVG